MVRLKDKYDKEVRPKLQEVLGFSNPMQVPRLEKIVVNMGMGVVDKDVFKAHTDQLALITGQKPLVTKARKSISNFKLRGGMSIGAKVTMRGPRMFEFLDRLISAALPRIRDFRGLPRDAFDGRGNYTMGIREHTVFPEIDPNHAGPTQGLDITLVTSARSDREALELLKLMGLPFAGK
jgi:large subunit ribosomal protein L5